MRRSHDGNGPKWRRRRIGGGGEQQGYDIAHTKVTFDWSRYTKTLGKLKVNMHVPQWAKMAHDSPNQLKKKKKKKQQQISPHRIMQTKSEEIALGELWLARARVLWCLFFFFCRMQFKHTLGQQDFMNRTENQEQSRAKKRGRGKKGKWDSGKKENRRWRSEEGKERSEREEMMIEDKS